MSHRTESSGFLRHVRACNNAALPGERVEFRIGTQAVGWVTPAMAAQLAAFPSIEVGGGGVVLTNPAALPEIARTLFERGVFRWRGEEFDVRAHPDGPALARIDRGAIPSFGIQAHGVHVNGLVQHPEGLHIWVARRARDKSLDPGKLDHIVAGGISAGMGRMDTLIKEAAEEAGIPAGLSAEAKQVCVISYAMERAEGLRRDVLYGYDLLLPRDFVPRAEDGEVEAFELWPMPRVLQAVRDTDAFKFNVNLVLIDLFIRQGLIAGPEAECLRAAL